jgi:gliding motility-associated-like protein
VFVYFFPYSKIFFQKKLFKPVIINSLYATLLSNQQDNKTLALSMLRLRSLQFFFFFLFPCFLSAQVNLTVTINSGSSYTSCTDPFGAPDPQWRVNIDNAGWEIYPSNGLCFRNTPYKQFDKKYNCVAEMPTTLEICYESFENDGFFCTFTPDCQTKLCQTFNVPAVGSSMSYDIIIPASATTGGKVNLTLSVTGQFVSTANDDICKAIDLGKVPVGGSVGNAALSSYVNFCATNTNEPNPNTSGGWNNDQGVWFTFTTSATPGPLTKVTVRNDPENQGNQLNTQVAVYESATNNCNGPFALVNKSFDPATNDEVLFLSCLKPNKKYFILVDGEGPPATRIEGYFGVEVEDLAVERTGDRICDAKDLGLVPTGGALNTGFTQSNICANSIGDPNASSFVVQQGVWLKFQAPPSGHIIIDAKSDNKRDSVDLQLALFKTLDDKCTGVKKEIKSTYLIGTNDESLELSCLVPNKPYWVLIDGSGFNTEGIFSIDIKDAGIVPPASVTPIFKTLCFGDSLKVGIKTYKQSDTIFHVLKNTLGCDSVVYGKVKVLPKNETKIDTFICKGDDFKIGNISHTKSGIFDEKLKSINGCDSLIHLILNVYDIQTRLDTTICFGQSIKVGTKTYNKTGFILEKLKAKIGCDSTITGTLIVLPFLIDTIHPVICYGDSFNSGLKIYDKTGFFVEKRISSFGCDSTLIIDLLELSPLEVTFQNQDPTCHDFCNGVLNANATGSLPPYTFNWSNGALGALVNSVCAQSYTLSLTDQKGCQKAFPATLLNPIALEATTSQRAPVRCFDESNGQAIVTANKPIQFVTWDNGEKETTATLLHAGIHTITVTDASGCTTTSSIDITQPDKALATEILVTQPVSCFDFSDAELDVAADGGNNGYTYQWSNKITERINKNLKKGTYSVTVTDSKGCVSSDTIIITEPTKVVASFTSTPTTCYAPNSGTITLDKINGGTSPYLYSSDGKAFLPDVILKNLVAGNYKVVVEDAEGCRFDFPMEVVPPPVVTVQASDDEAVLLGDKVTLTGFSPSNNIGYEWTPNRYLSCNTCLQPEAQSVKTITYRLLAKDTITGCVDSDFVKITVLIQRDVYIPNVFSPNTDKKNDFFSIFAGPEVETIERFAVFDRLGNFVYEAKNIPPNVENIGWDGTFRGVPMVQDVYTYFAVLRFINGEVLTYNGGVLLLR